MWIMRAEPYNGENMYWRGVPIPVLISFESKKIFALLIDAYQSWDTVHSTLTIGSFWVRKLTTENATYSAVYIAAEGPNYLYTSVW